MVITRKELFVLKTILRQHISDYSCVTSTRARSFYNGVLSVYNKVEDTIQADYEKNGYPIYVQNHTSGKPKLTEEDVRNLRKQFKEGKSYKELATYFNMSKRNIGRIIRKETWAHVK